MSFYSHYRGRCIGRLKAFVELYAGLSVADYATYGPNKVVHFGDWATYVWDGDTDTPVFTFLTNNNVDQCFDRKQEFLRPLFDEGDGLRFNNATYTIQEIGMIRSPSEEQVLCLMRTHLFGYSEDKIREYFPHFLRCGKIYRHYVDWRSQEIDMYGYVREGQYPGIPQNLKFLVKPQMPCAREQAERLAQEKYIAHIREQIFQGVVG